MSDLMIERLERAAKYCPLESELMLSAKAVIEQQQARIAELEAKTSCCMGVGNGNGRLFVYGDHESIKTAQRYVLEREELAATVERLLKACELARDSYGKMLMSDPPQEAWKVNQVTAKLVEAIAATPRQNLNAIKREVAREAWLGALSAYSRLRGNPNCEDELSIACERHASQRYPDKE